MEDNLTEKGSKEPSILVWDGSISSEITGEGPDGEPFLLGDDALIFFRMVAFEQPVLDRLRRSTDLTLRDELDSESKYPSHVFLGNPEDLREELKGQVDKLVDAIIKHRTKGSK